MSAATTKAELLAVIEAEHAKLQRLLDAVDEASAVWSDASGEVTVKAIIAHRTHWLDLFWRWYEGGVRGEPVETPAPGYKWNQLKAYNAPIYAAAGARSWRDIAAAFDDAHAQFVKRVTALDEATLYTPRRFAWLNDWTLGRWAESASASHYRSAAKFIRAARRANV